MAVPFITEVKRTHTCGQLTKAQIGEEVVLFGWVQNRRDHGGAVFIDLRDREGLTQVVFEPDIAKEAHDLAGQLRLEYCIGIKGKVVSRGSQVNPKLKTGEIEIKASDLTIFNRSEPTPFLVEDNIDTAEEKRLAYRFLDLRRRPLQQSLMTRSKMNAITRSYLNEHRFLELETPFMGKYTPGGARNFLVPSRLNPGKFYALAESPQLYKQLFMVAGFDRYFQIVKCFRDEDLRLDRQPEFTQIDIEMSFVTQDDVFTIVEGLIKKLWGDVLGIDVPTPFMRMDFDESMAKYGNDKPDLRFGLEHVVLTDLIRQHGAAGGVPMIWEAVEQGGIVKAMVIPGDKPLSRAESDKLEEFAKQNGAKGLARAKVGEGGEWTQSPLSKTITPALRQAITQACGAKTGDLIVFQFGRESLVHTVMANLRVHVAKKLGLIPEYGSGGVWKFLWVVNPPLFEYDEETKTWAAAHHAFTRPHDEHVQYLNSDPGRVKCHRYDVVLNGFEIGGGSIRLHDPKVQAEVFKALGIGDEEARTKFGFLLDALKFGAPPHGGIALGMDRLAFLLTGVESLRDVIPFPKTKTGTDLMTGAPGEVDERQLREVHVRAAPLPQK
ncbi:Aspartyl-tRNA synthetase [Cystobacter fuscus DSM 2262]|uniref:Aspartate--tRNA(Asp/Asn) ligase n=1 Tax=Cystobacter fuscus (strain ATCC 25194 / DSM 2262 / NBRC 100088 / M29) TaxID=1242864 RepID=S9PPT2_CYSF2|nr:aspartate--tRNA ligase [Cystobacter fuscus]EPX64482.1 Aspartyl-tRNA synthetase [Cystobacter fuscus DSM 2262]